MLIILFSIIAGSVLLDQVTKWLVVSKLMGNPSVPLIRDVLHFTYVENDGAAWGILDDQRWVFMVISTVAIIGLGVYLFGFRPKQKWISIPLAMIVGGGVGNMIDRVGMGYVVDFIDFRLINFPVFNVADCFVTVGAFALMGYMIYDLIREIRMGKVEDEDAVPSEQTETKDED